MYRILLVVSERGLETLYRYLTIVDEEGNEVIYEAETLADLDLKVEEMLNNGGYAKDEFQIVSMIGYNINADIV